MRKKALVTKNVSLTSIDEAIGLFGHLDSNIQRIEKECGVQVFIQHAKGGGANWPSLSVRGVPRKVEQALELIDDMRQILSRKPDSNGQAVAGSSVSNGSNYFDRPAGPNQHGDTEANGNRQAVYVTSLNKKIIPRTANQEKYVTLIKGSDLVISIGPAGTGKTYLAVACALADLKRGKVSRIVLTRPAVEAGEKLGYLPGDFYEKVNPYLRPLYDAFHSLLGVEKFKAFRDDETIEIVPLAFMRGRTMDNAFVILDEAQNTTIGQMKMFLTRMGNNSKIVINGDVTQIDLDDKNRSGLVHAEKIFKTVKEIKIVWLTKKDVVRHELVKKIIQAYEDWENKKR